MPALGGCRPPGEGCAGPGRLKATRRGLCRPREGAGHQERTVRAQGGCRPPGGDQEGSLPPQGGCRPPGGGCASTGRV